MFVDTIASLSRRDLVTTAANQDGGAHVDPALDEAYARFACDRAFGWISRDASGKEERLDGEVGVAIRQIAHELLKTLKPGYAKFPKPFDAIFLGATVQVVEAATRSSASSAVAAGVQAKVGRNAPCPCRSGKKSKRCCYP